MANMAFAFIKKLEMFNFAFEAEILSRSMTKVTGYWEKKIQDCI
jgi:hypothetical protein